MPLTWLCETLRTGLWSEQPWPEVWHARLSIWEQTCNLGWFTMLQLTAKHTRWCFGIYSLDYDDFQGCDVLRVIISVCWWELSHCQCHWSQDCVCREREEYGLLIWQYKRFALSWSSVEAKLPGTVERWAPLCLAQVCIDMGIKQIIMSSVKVKWLHRALLLVSTP